MNEQLQRDLLKRSTELDLPWCCLYPSQWRNFTSRNWVLCIDDRLPGRRQISTFPIENLASMTFPPNKPKRRKKKA
jgi:hypothetical protein